MSEQTMPLADVAKLVRDLYWATDYQCNVDRTAGYYGVLSQPEHRKLLMLLMPPAESLEDSRNWWWDVISIRTNQSPEMLALCQAHTTAEIFAKIIKRIKKYCRMQPVYVDATGRDWFAV